MKGALLPALRVLSMVYVSLPWGVVIVDSRQPMADLARTLLLAEDITQAPPAR